MMFTAGYSFAPVENLESFFVGDHNKLRVTLVRNPLKWMEHCFDYCQAVSQDEFEPFSLLPLHSFDAFIRAAVNNFPGSVTRLFDRYQADSVLRVEDLPWALEALLISCGADNSEQVREVAPLIHTGTSNQIDEKLRNRFMESEWDTYERYDYV
jgi:hypothetical protein